MHTIDVDFEVYKQLTIRRTTEEVSYNDVIRALLGIKEQTASAAKPAPADAAQDWVSKGVRFAQGTEFRASYKGKLHTAVADGGAMVFNGQTYTSPSAAAMSVTDSAVNGWRFWECRLPGKAGWQLIENLRR
jgi:predicted CopG family antitoxin